MIRFTNLAFKNKVIIRSLTITFGGDLGSIALTPTSFFDFEYVYNPATRFFDMGSI